jgi:TolB protein
MTGRSDLDRAMTAYFEGRTTSQPPDGLFETAMTQVEATRQRPAWLIPNRWLPVDRSGVVRIRTVVVLAVTVVAIVATAIAAGLLVGSQRQLPPPFGIAKPGLIAFDLGGHIFVANPDGTARRQLTSGRDGGATFSPDGTRIAYQTEAEDMTSSVMVMSADGGDHVVLADHLTQIGDIVWSPDSRKVAFSGQAPGTDLHVFTADIAHPGAVRLGGPNVYGVEPSWSPDGSRIAFNRFDVASKDVNTTGSLWVIGADGSNIHRMSSLQGTHNAFWNTAWSPDGSRLAFLAPGLGGNFDVYVVGADGTSKERNISNSPEEEYWPSWSPDGTRIAFAKVNPPATYQGTIVVVDPDGLHPIELSGTHVNSNTLVWSPDGKRLLAYATDPDPTIGRNVAIAIFDPTRDVPPTTIPAAGFGSATWQRLAP